MKFVVAKQSLAQVITHIQNVVPAKPSLPILTNIHLETRGQQLIVTATDLTVGMQCTVEARVLEEGETTLPAKRFFSLIKELTAMHIEISTNSHDVSEIIADSSTFRLNGMATSSYPTLPELAGATKFKIKQAHLKEMLYSTSFAVSKEDNRYALTGVYLAIDNRIATCVGTDGKRLARHHVSIDIDGAFSCEYILPAKMVDEVQKMLEDSEDEEATVYLLTDKVAIDTGSALIVSKLLTGEYPEYERVIPKHSSLQIALHRDELVSLLRQISLFVSDSNQSVRFTFDAGELILSANNVHIGEGKVSMPVNYTGQTLDIAFNPGFFLDVLRHTKDETVKLGLTDSYNPGVVTDSSSSLFVIMPMRLTVEV